MFYIETEFNKRKVGIRDVLLAFSFISLVIYALIFLAYRDSAAYYMAVLEKIEKQESELLLIDARQAEIHNSIRDLQDEILDN